MPTDNPKVSGYVPQAIYDRLIQFKDEQGVSVSQAITIVLAEYFEIETDIDVSASVGGVTLARLESLECQVKDLQKRISAFSISPESDSELISNLPSSPLRKNQTELARHLGISNSTLSKATKQKSHREFLEYTREKDPDGLGWCYLPDEKLYERDSDRKGELQHGLPLD